MKPIDYLKLAAVIVGVELIGSIGAIFTMSAIPTWYAHLARPSIAPPNWVFGPVWTLLFALMGIAAFLVWRAGWKRRDVKIALAIFLGQLALNVLWSVLFFGLHSPKAAFLELVVLWLAILATIGAFAKISKPAAILLLPYILWVSFAGALNVAFWMLNGA
jgi:tryptophan-rich sensory protein